MAVIIKGTARASNSAALTAGAAEPSALLSASGLATPNTPSTSLITELPHSTIISESPYRQSPNGLRKRHKFSAPSAEPVSPVPATTSTERPPQPTGEETTGAVAFRSAICTAAGDHRIALDTTDPVAGPQLIIADGYRVRCLNLRTEMVTTIAGCGVQEHVDGRASSACLDASFGIAVAPNGALFVSHFGVDCVRRISAAKWPAAGGAPAERAVTTLIGAAGSEVQFARSSAAAFRERLAMPWAMALFASTPPPSSASGAAVDADPDRDVGRLYVGCHGAVHAFDLVAGERKHFPIDGDRQITGLTVTDDGARLFAVTQRAVRIIDIRTGACTALISALADQFRAGPVTSDAQTTGGFKYAMGCVIDEVTRSLVMCEYGAHRIVRLRSVDV